MVGQAARIAAAGSSRVLTRASDDCDYGAFSTGSGYTGGSGGNGQIRGEPDGWHRSGGRGTGRGTRSTEGSLGCGNVSSAAACGTPPDRSGFSPAVCFSPGR